MRRLERRDLLIRRLEVLPVGGLEPVRCIGLERNDIRRYLEFLRTSGCKRANLLLRRGPSLRV